MEVSEIKKNGSFKPRCPMMDQWASEEELFYVLNYVVLEKVSCWQMFINGHVHI